AARLLPRVCRSLVPRASASRERRCRWRTIVLIGAMSCIRRFLPCIVVLGLVAPNAAAADDWTLESRTFADRVTAQPYIGNGYLGARIPAAGSGFVAAEGIQTWPTFAERFTAYPVDGVYAQEPSSFGDKEVLASVPAWST